MKLINWLKKVGQTIKNLITGANKIIDQLDETGKVVVPIAINVVEALKKFIPSPEADAIAGIVTAVIPGKADDVLVPKIMDWLEKELPRLAITLRIVDTSINLKSREKKLEIIGNILGIKGNGKLALEFSASLTGYLSDGKLTGDEMKELISKYYDKFVKK